MSSDGCQAESQSDAWPGFYMGLGESVDVAEHEKAVIADKALE